jgi:cytosine/adenosine deaminase-related metal-dependent hydrolase
MFIVSPKWIYLNNTRLEMDKSILIDGPIIKDILKNETIKKRYKEISRIEYPNHVLMPTFTESYLNLNIV